jgi:hypothetical protein
VLSLASTPSVPDVPRYRIYAFSFFFIASLHEGKVKSSICFKINLNAIHLPILFSNVATHLWS